jgi:Protein of unknown function (DUF3800)
VETFIDESGQFTQTTGWSVVSALSLPDSEVGRARRKLAYLTRDWPKAPKGELKGGSLDANHLAALVDLLFARDALLHAVAIDMARESDAGLKDHKRNQCELLTANLTPAHHSNLVAQVWALRRTLEGMPVQLYVQSILMTELTATVVERITMYFAQRRPRELGNFSWIIDAKDPRRITTQERWWQDTLGPLQESHSRRKPLGRVDDPAFDYRFFDKAYEFTKQMWYPDKPSEPITGYDIRKILSDRISFKDSRSDILLQAIDILTSFLRRLLMGRIIEPAVAKLLGRLQIHQRPAPNVYQSIHLLTFTTSEGTEGAQLGRLLKQMSLAGRSMILR